MDFIVAATIMCATQLHFVCGPTPVAPSEITRIPQSYISVAGFGATVPSLPATTPSGVSVISLRTHHDATKSAIRNVR
jgi:hypothetical protein